MLATEEPTSPTADRATQPLPLEQHADNPPMRHIPAMAWMVQKLDVDVRHRIEKLWLPYSDLPASDPRHPKLEAEFRSLCRALERVSEIARRHGGKPHPPNDLGSRIPWTLSQAVSTLSSADADTFGKRLPFHTGERSGYEPLWAAVLSVIERVHRLVPLVREIEPDIDERLYEGLVQLREPLRRDPIA